MRTHSTTIGLLAVSTLLLGCQGGSAPLAPAAVTGSDPFEPGVPREGGLLGGFDLHLDPVSQQVTLTADKATAAIGDTYSELGLAPAFTTMFGRNFQVRGFQFGPNGEVEVELGIRHPFAPTARPDLAIFNLKCWAVSDLPAVNLGGVSALPGLVTNAAGYGRMWLDTASAAPGFNAAPVQPYILLREDTAAGAFDFQNPAGYNVFFPGMESTATLSLQLSNASAVTLRLYLTADYGQSAVRATRQTPQYELPKFAGNAAWKVAVTELANNLEAGQTASTAQYQVDIWDWKHDQGLGSDVASATLQVPGVTTSPLTLSLSGSGTDPTPLTGTALVTNLAGGPEGDYWGLVTVTDSATSGVALQENLTTPVTITSYVTYQLFPVTVGNASLPPTAAFTRCYGGDMKVGIGDTFDASPSTPGSNPITTYEWDWDYDGSNFTVDATGLLVAQAYPSAGTRTVALRVSDGTPSGWNIATASINITGSATWNATQRLTNNSLYEQYQGFGSNVTHNLVQTADGTVHVLYPEVTGTFPAYTFEHYHQEYSGCPPTWQPRTLVSSTLNTSNYQWNCSLAAVGNTLHASFTGPSTPSAYPEFRHAKLENGTWSILGPITNYIAGMNVWVGGHIVAKTDGTLVFAGKRRGLTVCPGTPGPAMPVYATSFNGTSWAPVTQIGDRYVVLNSSACGSYTLSDEDMDLVATADNEVLTVWSAVEQQYDGFTSITSSYSIGLKYNKTTGGSWGTQSYAYNGVNRNSNPVLARSPNGTIWLAVGTGTQSSISMGQFNGTSWTPLSVARSVTTGSEAYFGFGFNAQGEGVLTHSHNQPTTYINYIRFTETTPLSSLSSIAGTAVEGGSFARIGQQVLGMADGRHMALWLTDKYGGGPFTAREIDWSVWQ